MIAMIRVDDRLVHGQVAMVWSKELNVDRILVANDEAANSEMQKNVLKMAAPASVKVSVVTVKKAVELLTDARSEKLRILVIVNKPQDLFNLLTKIKEKPPLNLANYGRIGGVLAEKTKITETVYLTEGDKQVVKEIFNYDVEFIYQPLPTDPRKKFKDLVKEGG